MSRATTEHPSFGQWLTDLSDNIIDATRIGNRIRYAPNYLPQYTQKELLTRAFILTCTLGSAYAAHVYTPDDSTPMKALKILSATLIGLIVAHIPFIEPTQLKRLQAKTACTSTYNELKVIFTKHPLILQALEHTHAQILKISKAADGRANSTLTWETRCQAMKIILDEAKKIDLNDNARLNGFNDYLSALTIKLHLEQQPKNQIGMRSGPSN